MNILEQIVDYKRKVVQETRELNPVKRLEQSIFFETTPVSLKTYLTREDKVGVIAEIKRSSPSTGVINNQIDVEKLSINYMQAGASALSVLTDTKYFGGSNIDLEIARKNNFCPILRKEFIIDEYQIIEAKSIGADCILLIAACLTPQECKTLAAFAKSLNLEVLLEVQAKEEIDSYVNPYIDIIGVNNRNLKDFTTNISNSIELLEFLPKELVKISESGIKTAEQMLELKNAGFDGFLIGGYFMHYDDPGEACKNLIKNYKALLK
ncbi:MAG TPA: indole-3-glycerol phosphate synthase TrpC [Brumimicrobium sp.]|nr:indole-3-glycerol phosphate synthase TrpC [Brumimicrobium sp.]